MREFLPGPRTALGCLLSAIVSLALAAPASAATYSFGDISVTTDAPLTGTAKHGYTEYGFLLLNQSSASDHAVTLTMPRDNGYASGDHVLAGLSRTVVVGKRAGAEAPPTAVRVSLLQPSMPPVAGSGISVTIDGRMQEQGIPVNVPGYAITGMGGPTVSMAKPAGGPGWPGGAGWRSSGNGPLILVGPRLGRPFVNWASRMVLAEGDAEPGNEPPPGFPGMPGGPGPGFRRPRGEREPGAPRFGWRGQVNVNPLVESAFHTQDTSASWPTTWLAFTRYDGVALAAEDVRRMPGESQAALWQYVESGGVLLVVGKFAVPPAWKPAGDPKGGVTTYRPVFGMCILTDAVKVPVVPEFPPGGGEPGFDQPFPIEEKPAPAERPAPAPAAPAKPTDEVTTDALVAFGKAAQATALPWSNVRSASEANRYFPAVDNVSIPVVPLFGVMLLFSLVIGPVNLVVLTQMRKRIWLLWTVPAFSFLTCATVFGTMVLVEGWAGHRHASGVTVLDEGSERAVTLGMVGFYSPLAPVGGLRFDADTELTWQSTDYDPHGYYPGRRRSNGSACFLDWSSGQHLTGGWISARVPSHFQLRKVKTHRERIGIDPAGDGLRASNLLGVPVSRLWYADAEGRVWEASELPVGGTVTLTVVGGARVPAEGEEPLRRLYTNNDWVSAGGSSAVRELMDHPRKYLVPRSYVAVLTEDASHTSPFVESGLRGARNRVATPVLYGIQKGGPG